VEPTIGVFTFEGYPGEEFRCRLSVPLGQYLAFMVRWTNPAGFEEFQSMIEEFVALAEPTWTLPALTFQGLDWALTKAIVNAWVAAVPEVPAPLLAESSVTARPREHSTEPQAADSPRRPSSRSHRRSARS